MIVLGETSVDSATALVDSFLASNPSPSQADIKAFLALMSGGQRDRAAQVLSTRLSPQLVYAARMSLTETRAATWKTYATVAAAAGAAFHGYRRNQSLFWGLAWFALGSLFPITTTVVALAQGYGAPRKG